MDYIFLGLTRCTRTSQSIQRIYDYLKNITNSEELNRRIDAIVSESMRSRYDIWGLGSGLVVLGKLLILGIVMKNTI